MIPYTNGFILSYVYKRLTLNLHVNFSKYSKVDPTDKSFITMSYKLINSLGTSKTQRLATIVFKMRVTSSDKESSHGQKTERESFFCASTFKRMV